MTTLLSHAEMIDVPRQPVSADKDNGKFRSVYFGNKPDGSIRDEPQGYRVDMDANEVVKPHFHHVDQYQLFVYGTGSIGREQILKIGVHYVDHHTGYGPIIANDAGLAYLTLRAQTDSGAVYIGKPGYREQLKPSKKRHFTVTDLSDGPEAATAGPLQTLYPLQDDGLACFMVRSGADSKATLPSPAGSGGQFVYVVRGALVVGGTSYTEGSLGWVSNQDSGLEGIAGSDGLEAVIMQFPKSSIQ